MSIFLSGLANALGLGLQGYGQDKQIQFQRTQQQQQMALEKAKFQMEAMGQGFFPADGTPSPSTTQPAPPPMGPTTNRGPQAVRAALMRRTKDGFALSGPPQGAQDVASPAPSGSNEGSDPLSGAMSALTAMDGQQMNIPGVGNFSYNFSRSPAMRGVILDMIKRHGATDEDVRKAGLTGETAKNIAETNLANRNVATPRLGDPGYAKAMGGVAAAEAQGRLGADLQKLVQEKKLDLENALKVENSRADVQRQLQKNQQDFETGKIAQEQKNALDKQAMDQQGEFLNSLGLEQYRESGQILPSVTRSVKGFFGQGSPTPTTAPSLRALTPQQVVRAHTDPNYKSFLESQGYKLY